MKIKLPWPKQDQENEAELCDHVANLELSDSPGDHVAAQNLRSQFDLDGVWIETTKAEKKNDPQ